MFPKITSSLFTMPAGISSTPLVISHRYVWPGGKQRDYTKTRNTRPRNSYSWHLWYVPRVHDHWKIHLKNANSDKTTWKTFSWKSPPGPLTVALSTWESFLHAPAQNFLSPLRVLELIYSTRYDKYSLNYWEYELPVIISRHISLKPL